VDELLDRLELGFGLDTVAIIAQRAHRHREWIQSLQDIETNSPLTTDDISPQTQTHFPSPSPPLLSVSPPTSASNTPSPTISTAASEDVALDLLCFEFLEQNSVVPDWIDWEQVAAGQILFQRHNGTSLFALLYASLVGGFGAPLITKVLTSTTGMTRSCPATYKRLIETCLWVCACIGPNTQTLLPAWGSAAGQHLKETGKSASSCFGNGWLSCLRVRFLHGSVRRMLYGRKQGWDSQTYGTPINQEDMLVTLLAFSVNLIICLRRAGHQVSSADAEAYMHLWRVISFYSGLEIELIHKHMGSFHSAQCAFQSLVYHLVHPDITSIALAKHVMISVHHCFPIPWSIDFHQALAETLMTSEWYELMQLPKASQWQQIKVWIFLRLLTLVVLLANIHPRIIQALCTWNYWVTMQVITHRFSGGLLKQLRDRRAMRGTQRHLNSTGTLNRNSTPWSASNSRENCSSSTVTLAPFVRTPTSNELFTLQRPASRRESKLEGMFASFPQLPAGSGATSPNDSDSGDEGSVCPFLNAQSKNAASTGMGNATGTIVASGSMSLPLNHPPVPNVTGPLTGGHSRKSSALHTSLRLDTIDESKCDPIPSYDINALLGNGISISSATLTADSLGSSMLPPRHPSLRIVNKSAASASLAPILLNGVPLCEAEMIDVSTNFTRAQLDSFTIESWHEEEVASRQCTPLPPKDSSASDLSRSGSRAPSRTGSWVVGNSRHNSSPSTPAATSSTGLHTQPTSVSGDNNTSTSNVPPSGYDAAMDELEMEEEIGMGSLQYGQLARCIERINHFKGKWKNKSKIIFPSIPVSTSAMMIFALLFLIFALSSIHIFSTTRSTIQLEATPLTSQ
jgi:hypothetical protein